MRNVIEYVFKGLKKTILSNRFGNIHHVFRYPLKHYTHGAHPHMVTVAHPRMLTECNCASPELLTYIAISYGGEGVSFQGIQCNNRKWAHSRVFLLYFSALKALTPGRHLAISVDEINEAK